MTKEFEVILDVKRANGGRCRLYAWRDGSITIKSGVDQSGSIYVPNEIVSDPDSLENFLLGKVTADQASEIIDRTRPSRTFIHEEEGYDT
jgi:hypothetical protein